MTRAELMQRELEVGLERWQDRVLLGQWAALGRAQIQARLNLETRLSNIHHKNNLKNIFHTHNINK
jgi:hypothetical protein